jgi:hypothetical protein
MFPPGWLLNLSVLESQVTLGADNALGVNKKLPTAQGIVRSEFVVPAVRQANWPAPKAIKSVATVQIRPDADRRPAYRPRPTMNWPGEMTAPLASEMLGAVHRAVLDR